jgi:hypothetical protein
MQQCFKKNKKNKKIINLVQIDASNDENGLRKQLKVLKIK